MLEGQSCVQAVMGKPQDKNRNEVGAWFIPEMLGWGALRGFLLQPLLESWKYSRIRTCIPGFGQSLGVEELGGLQG